MRAFVAVEVPSPEHRSASAPDHLTLLFLGEIDPETTGSISEALAPVGRATAPFDVALEHVGAFPSVERPRVVWLGATDGAPALKSLATGIRRALPYRAEEREGAPFVPHLTLFRVRSARDRERAFDLLSGRAPAPPPRRFRVHEFVLKESVLAAHGATHRTVASFPLEGPGS